jgi:hypothetical protein
MGFLDVAWSKPFPGLGEVLAEEKNRQVLGGAGISESIVTVPEYVDTGASPEGIAIQKHQSTAIWNQLHSWNMVYDIDKHPLHPSLSTFDSC